MSDLKKYINERKKRDKEFATNYEEGYEQFKVGVMLREARESSGLTQDEVARRLKTKKTAISRIENHAEDIKLSTLERFASALGKKLTVNISSGFGDSVAEESADYRVGRTKGTNILKLEGKVPWKGNLPQARRARKFKAVLEKVNKVNGKTLKKLAE
jgi:HTH-type transcriptional regulator/antitoxin HipB